MNPEAGVSDGSASEGQNGQKEIARYDSEKSASGTTSSTNQSTGTPIAATPIAPHQGDSPKGMHIYIKERVVMTNFGHLSCARCCRKPLVKARPRQIMLA